MRRSFWSSRAACCSCCLHSWSPSKERVTQAVCSKSSGGGERSVRLQKKTEGLAGAFFLTLHHLVSHLISWSSNTLQLTSGCRWGTESECVKRDWQWNKWVRPWRGDGEFKQSRAFACFVQSAAFPSILLFKQAEMTLVIICWQRQLTSRGQVFSYSCESGNQHKLMDKLLTSCEDDSCTTRTDKDLMRQMQPSWQRWALSCISHLALVDNSSLDPRLWGLVHRCRSYLFCQKTCHLNLQSAWFR